MPSESSHPIETTYDLTNDRAIVQHIRNGDVAAFRALYLCYFNRLLEFGYAVLRSREAAMDAVQDVFASLWERRETWEVRERVEVYLYQAVRYRALHLLRHQRLSAHKHVQLSVENSCERLEARVPLPDDTAQLEELQGLVLEVIGQLPDAQREAMLLHWRYGLSNTEVAQVMERSVGAVAVYLSRARETLRARLSKFF